MSLLNKIWDRTNCKSKYDKGWRRSGLLDGLTGNRNENLAQLFESQQRQFIGGGEQFANVVFPAVRRVFANLTANDIVQVQPLAHPSGRICYIDTIDGRKIPFRCPKIIGGTIEEYMINLISEWNSFVSFYNTSPTTTYSFRNDGVEHFTYLASKLKQYNPDIYEVYSYTKYDYNVFDYIEKEPKYNFKKYLDLKPKEILGIQLGTQIFHLFFSKENSKIPMLGLGNTMERVFREMDGVDIFMPQPIQLGGRISDEILIDEVPEDR